MNTLLKGRYGVETLRKEHPTIYNLGRNVLEWKKLLGWLISGRPDPPPPFVKQRIIKEYARKFGTEVMVETGTFFGDMVNATKHDFKEIFSIELDDMFFRRAKERFEPYGHIHILQGDSAEVLPKLLPTISKRALFWLDAHYSGGITAKADKETPIMQELGAIFAAKNQSPVILIDDTRCFGTGDYPSLEEVKDFVFKLRPGWHFTVKSDIIRIHE